MGLKKVQTKRNLEKDFGIKEDLQQQVEQLQETVKQLQTQLEETSMHLSTVKDTTEQLQNKDILKKREL